MALFYCTRGWKDGKEGTAHPIEAPTESHARKYMFNTFGGDWCTSYTEEAWDRAKQFARERGHRLEPEVPKVVVGDEVFETDEEDE